MFSLKLPVIVQVLKVLDNCKSGAFALGYTGIHLLLLTGFYIW